MPDISSSYIPIGDSRTLDSISRPSPQLTGTSGALLKDSFAGASVDLGKWSQTIGVGGTISQASNGTLTMGSGTTADDESYLLSSQTFKLPCKVAVALQLSQRIINNTFGIGLVSVDPSTGLPDGQEKAELLFLGTTSVNARQEVTTGGLPVSSATNAFPTTASSQLFEIEASANKVWFHGSANDSSNNRINSYRLNIKSPDPSRLYKLRLDWLNGATPPASNTNALLTYLACEEYQELATEIVGTRGTASTGAALGNAVAQAVLRPSGSSIPFLTLINSTASTNSTSTANGTRDLFEITLTNYSATAKFFKLYNNSTAPTVGTDTPVANLAIPALSDRVENFGALGKRFPLGIGYAITGLQPVADTTVVGAGDVVGSFSWG